MHLFVLRFVCSFVCLVGRMSLFLCVCSFVGFVAYVFVCSFVRLFDRVCVCLIACL